ncbi:MAG: hypothetical protein QME93_09995, partial [Bacillota bacterium]|nr:hypothetical protein [Bacillota bacterium]
QVAAQGGPKMWLLGLAVAVSLDGMWAGLAQGLRGRYTTASQLAAVGVESAAGRALAMAGCHSP